MTKDRVRDRLEITRGEGSAQTYQEFCDWAMRKCHHICGRQELGDAGSLALKQFHQLVVKEGWPAMRVKAQALYIAILKCRIKDFLRSPRHRTTRSLTHEPNEPGGLASAPEELLHAKENADRNKAWLEQGLAQLPLEQREVIELHDLRGLTQEQIARHLNISIGTVKSRLSRGRIALRQHLESNQPTPTLIGPPIPVATRTVEFGRNHEHPKKHTDPPAQLVRNAEALGRTAPHFRRNADA